jgi:hypothetical protein
VSKFNVSENFLVYTNHVQVNFHCFQITATQPQFDENDEIEAGVDHWWVNKVFSPNIGAKFGGLFGVHRGNLYLSQFVQIITRSIILFEQWNEPL